MTTPPAPAPAPGRQFQTDRQLPEALPSEPFATLRAWLAEAEEKKILENPNAMTLATADARGRPSARIVLAKEIDVKQGRVVFFTNRASKKGQDLAANPWASLVFHWDALSLQARVDGPVTEVSDAESDAYFATRWALSRVGAWASEQSKPIESREALLMKLAETALRFNVPLDGETDAPVPRPPNWGGYSVWAERVELWIGHPGRIHDRAQWTRTLRHEGQGYAGGAWASTRLQP